MPDFRILPRHTSDQRISRERPIGCSAAPAPDVPVVARLQPFQAPRRGCRHRGPISGLGRPIQQAASPQIHVELNPQLEFFTWLDAWTEPVVRTASGGVVNNCRQALFRPSQADPKRRQLADPAGTQQCLSAARPDFGSRSRELQFKSPMLDREHNGRLARTSRQLHPVRGMPAIETPVQRLPGDALGVENLVTHARGIKRHLNTMEVLVVFRHAVCGAGACGTNLKDIAMDLDVKRQNVAAQICPNAVSHEDIPEGRSGSRFNITLPRPGVAVDRVYGMMPDNELMMRIAIGTEHVLQPLRLHKPLATEAGP